VVVVAVVGEVVEAVVGVMFVAAIGVVQAVGIVVDAARVVGHPDVAPVAHA